MTVTLVLYEDGLLDPRAGAELIRERHPEAKLVALRDGGCVGVELRSHDGPAWVLGLNGVSGENVTAVDRTPDASITLQVRRKLARPVEDADECRDCENFVPTRSSDVWGRCTSLTEGASEGDLVRRDGCCGDLTPRKPVVPYWVRILDDAVCGRFKLPNSEPAWACVTSYPLEEGLKILTGWEHWRDRIEIEGRAVIRERERSKKRHGEKREIDRIRAERDALLHDVCDDEACGREMYEMAGREASLRNERDEALAHVDRALARLHEEQATVDELRVTAMRQAELFESVSSERDDYAATLVRTHESRSEIIRERDDLRQRLADAEAVATRRLTGLREALEMVPKPDCRRGCRGCDYGLGDIGYEHEDGCRYVVLRELAGENDE